jgi:hypothetical protein
MLIQVPEASRIPNRHDQNRTSPWHIIVKTSSKERILKTAGRNNKSIIKGSLSKIITHFSTENLKARRVWNEVFKAWKK